MVDVSSNFFVGRRHLRTLFLTNNTEYAFNSCTASPILRPFDNNSNYELGNITIIVQGASMVPRLRIANRTTVRNLTILFIDVMWSIVVNDTHRLHDGTNTGDTVLLSLRECTVEGLNVTMLRTNLSIVNNITMSPTSIANNMSENFMKVVLLEVYTDENTERGNAANVSFTLLTSSMGAVKLSSMPKAPDCSICTLTPGLFLGSLLR